MRKKRSPKRPPTAVNQWTVLLTRAAKGRRLDKKIRHYQILKLAGYITLVGSTSNEDAQMLFAGLVDTFITLRRITQWNAGLRRLPVDRDGLVRIGRALRAAKKIEDVGKARFSLTKVFRVMVQLPDPDAYVDVVTPGFNNPTIATIFHPNTHSYAAKKYRGVCGDLAEDGQEHQKQVAAKVRHVR